MRLVFPKRGANLMTSANRIKLTLVATILTALILIVTQLVETTYPGALHDVGSGFNEGVCAWQGLCK